MGYKIKEYRVGLGMTQEELANKSGITRATIIRLESDQQTDIKVSNLKKLAKALGCRISDLLS